MKLTNWNQNVLFDLSNDQWIALNRWIGDITTEGNTMYKKFPNGFPPSFQKIIISCQRWTTSTFSNINEITTDVENYATSAIGNFSSIQASFDKLPSNAPVPKQLQKETKTAISDLTNKTDKLYSKFQPILTDFKVLSENFTKLNEQWTSNPEKYSAFCDFILFLDYLPIPAGGGSEGISTFLSDFLIQYILIFEICEGGWLALKNDLSAAALSPINVNNAFLASLDLGICINDWQNLQNNASGFAQIVTEAHALWKNPDVQSPWETDG